MEQGSTCLGKRITRDEAVVRRVEDLSGRIEESQSMEERRTRRRVTNRAAAQGKSFWELANQMEKMKKNGVREMGK